MSAPRIFDRALLVRRRDRAAVAHMRAGALRGLGQAETTDTLDLPDFLLRRVADELADRLAVVNRTFTTALDLGCHHGLLGRALREKRNIATIVSMDAAALPLRFADGLKVVADEEFLPFGEATFDLVVSGLSLQAVNDLPGTLAQVRRCLKPDGLLLAAMLGGATLGELRQAFLLAETECDGGASPRVAPFADVRDLGALLQRTGFALPVVDSDIVTVAYASPLHLMRELRAMGATNVLTDRRRQPLSRATLARVCEVYGERFSRPDGRVTATFEILTMTAWAPHESQQRPLVPGSAKARLADALGVTEHSARQPGGTDQDDKG